MDLSGCYHKANKIYHTEKVGPLPTIVLIKMCLYYILCMLWQFCHGMSCVSQQQILFPQFILKEHAQVPMRDPESTKITIE